MSYKHKCGNLINLDDEKKFCVYCGGSIVEEKQQQLEGERSTPRQQLEAKREAPRQQRIQEKTEVSIANKLYKWLIAFGILFIFGILDFMADLFSFDAFLFGILLLIVGISFYLGRDKPIGDQERIRKGKEQLEQYPKPQFEQTQYVKPIYQQEVISSEQRIMPFTPIEHVPRDIVIPKWDPKTAFHTGVVDPLNEFLKTIQLLREKQEFLENHVNTLKQERTIEVLDNSEEQLNDLMKLRNEIENTKREISVITAELNEFKNEYNKLNVERYFEYLQSSIDEARLLFPSLQKEFDDFPYDSFHPMQLILDELASKYDAAIQKQREALGVIIQEPTPQITPITETKVSELAPKKIEVTPTPLKVQEIPETEHKVAPFRLRTFIEEKLISNLFAYVGAFFIIVGFMFLIIYFSPEPTETDRAPDYILLAYSIGGILVASGVILRIGLIIAKRPRLNPLFNFISAIGYASFALALYGQAFFFDEEFRLIGYEFIIPGICITASAFVLSYINRSQILGVASVSLSLFIGFAAFTEERIYEDTVIDLNGFIGFSYYFVLLVVCTILTRKRGFWMPLAIYGVFTPVLWFANSDYIAIPGFLLLFITIVNVYLIVSKKMPASKSFSNFLGTVFLIYPNSIAINIILDGISKEETISDFKLFEIVVIFGGFFILYWIFVLFEKDIDISFELPISFNFRNEEMAIRPFYQRLNWLMLSSLVFLIFTGLVLYDNKIYEPLIIFASLLSITAIIGLKYNFDTTVPNSVFGMLATAEIFFLLSFNHSGTSQIITAIFLISIPVFYEMLRRTKRNINILNFHLKAENMAYGVAGISLINFVMLGFKEFGPLFILLASICWLAICTEIVFRRKDDDQQLFGYVAIGVAVMIPFVAGIFHNERWIWYAKETEYDKYSLINHFALNFAILLFPIFAFLCVWYGDRLALKSLPTKEFPAVNSWYDNAKQMMQTNYLFYPQATIFAIPAVVFAYGNEYFFTSPNRQGLLIIHLLIYFVSIPLQYRLSLTKKNHSYEELATFTSYFAFLTGFVLLGGAKKVYNLIVKPPSVSRGSKPLFPLEYGILLFLAIAIFTIAASVLLTNKVLYSKKSPIEVTEDEQEKEQINQEDQK